MVVVLKQNTHSLHVRILTSFKKAIGRRVWAPAVEDLNVDDTAFLINAIIHGHKHKINKTEQTVQITISITLVTLVNIPLNHSNPKKP